MKAKEIMPDNNDQDTKMLKSLLEQAVQKACAEEGLLTNRGGASRKGNEQSIVFRVGVHLHELLKNTDFSHLNLDCEYNKCGNDPKETFHFPKGIRPDLLVHSRGNQASNRLAVEFKGWWNNKPHKDIQKLKDLTNDDGAYKYQLGILVLLKEQSQEYRYFQHGQEVGR